MSTSAVLCFVLLLAFALTLLMRIVSDPMILNSLNLTVGNLIGAPAIHAHLYDNLVVVNADTVLGDFVEATFAGYAPQLLTGWTGATFAIAHQGIVSAALNSWVITGGSADIYGVFFTDATGTVLYGAADDPSAPVTIDAAVLNTYSVFSSLTCQSA